MIEEPATVVAVAPGLAWVETQRRSACGQCGKATDCGTSAIAKLFGEGRQRWQILDPLGLRTGEQVIIGIGGDTLVSASLLAYLPPLIGLLAAAGTATRLGLAEGWVASAGLAGLAAGLWFSGRLAGQPSRRERFRPRLLGRKTPTRLDPIAPTRVEMAPGRRQPTDRDRASGEAEVPTERHAFTSRVTGHRVT